MFMAIYSVISMSKTLNLLAIKYQCNKKRGNDDSEFLKKKIISIFLALVSGKK